jgi:methylglutamate dehydrogenase subunit D
MTRTGGASVPDFSWPSRSPLQTAIAARSIAKQRAGVSLAELRDFELAQVMVRRGKWTEAAAASQAHFGVTPPDEPRVAFAPGVVLVWSGPDQFLALSKAGENTLDMLKRPFEGIASLSDQSSGRVLVRVSGAETRAMLAKLSSVDLDDGAFPIGAAAATSIDHTGVNLWRGPDADEGAPAFLAMILSSYADSITHALLDASAEYGVELLASSFNPESAVPARHSLA